MGDASPFHFMEIKKKLRYFWAVITFNTGRVLFTDSTTERYFSRCISCGRVFMHYWGCVTAADREKGKQIGCKCGGMKFRIINLPKWQQAWFLFSRYIWRKLILKERYWDPRMPARVKNEEVA